MAYFVEDCGTPTWVTEAISPMDKFLRVNQAGAHARTAAVPAPFLAGWPLWKPLLVLFAISAILRWTPLDLWISSLFYDPTTNTWPWFYSTWCTFFYRRGVYPPFAVTIGASLMILIGGLQRHRNDYVRRGLFLLAVFFVGPGLIVNTTFKPHWGRPRPHQVLQFGGCETFAPLGSPGTLASNNSSFPSGHAAVAFYMISPAFLMTWQRRRLAWTMLIGGLLFGTCMSITRIIQGGHFTSDVLWSAAVVYFTCVGLARLMLKPRIDPARVSKPDMALPCSEPAKLAA